MNLRGVCTLFQLAMPVVVAFDLAVAQPLLDLIGRNPAFLAAHDAQRGDVLLLAVALVLVVPMVLAAPVLAVRAISSRASSLLLMITLTLTLMPLYFNILSDVALSGPAVILAAVTLAVASALFIRLPANTGFMIVAALVPAAVLVSFVFFTPTRSLLLPADGTAQAVYEPAVANPPPIVFVLFDEFALTSLLTAGGALDAGAYPNFARLAQDATFFTNVASVHPQTQSAVPAMLTGRFVTEKKSPTLSEHPTNLFTLLGPHYKIFAEEPVTMLCPPKDCTQRKRSRVGRLLGIARDSTVIARHIFTPRPYAADLPPIDEGWGDFDAGAQPVKHPGVRALFHDSMERDRGVRFRRALRRIAPSDAQPAVHFIHALLPHSPWEYVPSGHRYATAGRTGVREGTTWVEDPWFVAQSYQRHLLQVGFLDHLLGRLLDRLESQGMYDESLVVVTADHGVSFRPGEPYRLFNRETLGESGWVPLFIKAPGQQAGGIDDRPLLTVDVLPTVLETFGGETAHLELDGIAAQGPIPAGRDRSVPEQSWPDFDVQLRDEATARKWQLFPQSADRPSVTNLAPTQRIFGLLGEPESDLRAVPGDAVVALQQPWSLTAVDLDGNQLPVEHSGRVVVSEDQAPVEHLAFAVNGRIEAATTVQPTRDSTTGEFTVVLPWDSLQEGLNTFQPYVVTERGFMRATLVNEGDFTFHEEGRHDSLKPRRGEPVRVAQASGGTAQRHVADGFVTVSGSLAEDRGDLVVVLVDGQAVAVTVPQRRNPAAAVTPDGSFSVDIPLDLVTAGREMRVMAVSPRAAIHLAERGRSSAGLPPMVSQ